MYRVLREVHFSYGHRIVGHEGKCANLHGHNGRAIIEVSSERLDKLGMVVDFAEINEKVGSWIDETLDHKMILWKKDPAVQALREKDEVLFLTDENPTAEYLAELIFKAAAEKGLPVTKVTLHETHSSAASYERSGRGK